MFRAIRRRHQEFARERGQAMLEFALLLPVVILLLFVIVDFGIAMDRRLTLQNAVREGARFAALSVDQNTICERTLAQTHGIVGGGDITISYDDVDGNGVTTDAGDAVNVQADFTYSFPIVRDIAKVFGVDGFSVVMHPKGSARLERQHPQEFGPTCA